MTNFIEQLFSRELIFVIFSLYRILYKNSWVLVIQEFRGIKVREIWFPLELMPMGITYRRTCTQSVLYPVRNNALF